ncbi:hypothetical protein AB0C12_05740 [Actinoplanes sp. NPDC048967]|uniref:hypothetical protein n=1 Tax=Actinoplanes sp. NPDC048967 TaxID=3155269 RepID=UPI0033D236B8
MRRRLAVALAIALLAGCSSSPASQPATTGCASAAPDGVVVTVAVQDGRAEPAPHRVKVPLGSAVLLRVEADADAEVHVHGYDLTTEAKPGSAGCVSFVADRSGLFDVEAHPETLLVQLEVR